MATGDKLMTAAEIKAVTDTKLDKASVYNALDKTTSGFALDARKGAALNDSLSATQSGIAIIVSGDMASMAVPVGGYAYIKDNTHGLAEGLYTNTSSAAFPTVGGTADSTVFTAVSGGGLNTIQKSLDRFIGGLTGEMTIPPKAEFTSDIIPFGRTFASTPAVVANVTGYYFPNEMSHIVIKEVSTSGFQFRIRNLLNETWSIRVSWMAYDYT